MSAGHFADRLLELTESKRSQVVVGLDPRLERMPEDLVQDCVSRHGRTPAAAAEAIGGFNRAVIDEVCRAAVAVKPQVAFYERWGIEGLRAYAETVRYARSRGLLVIGDVKRGDISSTAEAYAAAHLPPGAAGAGGDWLEAGDFHADAITVNPLFGSDGVGPFVERAAEGSGGLFVLVRTSNPSSEELQGLRCARRPLYRHIAALVERWGEPYRGECGYSLVGAVVPGTFPEVLAELRRAMPHTPLLVPGFGAQGAGVADVTGAFDGEGLGALVSSSRAIAYAYEAEHCACGSWREAISEAAESMRSALWAATHGG